MSTATLQLKIQRHRFAQHAAATLAARLPQAFRSFLRGASRAQAASTAPGRAAQQAAAVCAMAQAYQRTDPGFAADLFAAASRHEGLSTD